MPLSLDSTSLGANAVSQLPTSTKAQATTASSSTDSGMGNVKDLSSTFLQLLTQELQNQDPTAPMDSTQMVGQMISLNQLEQLTSINQTLSTQAGSSSSTQAASGTPSATSKAVDTSGGVAQSSSAGAAQAAMQAASMGNTLGTTSSLLQNAGLAGN